MLNAFTVDVEDWYQTHDFDFDFRTWDRFEDRVEYSTRIILEMLAECGVKATFFVLGCVAQRHPELVREIAGSGHEVGCHGGWHRMISHMRREEFREDLRWSRGMLEDISGCAVNLFRAPSWSISRDSLWALQILEEEGFICDSSIQPVHTPLSGINNAQLRPYYPIVDGHTLKLLEFPPTVLSWGKMRLPFAGGWYLRAIPLILIVWGLKKVNQMGPALVYIHPWEMDPEQPHLPASIPVRLSHYLNLAGNREKVRKLLARVNFAPLGEVIKEGNFVTLPVTGGKDIVYK